MRLVFLYTVPLAVIISSCSIPYRAYKDQYSFRSDAGDPDYSNLNCWAAHPRKADPSDSIPLPLRGEPRDTVADVFFIHPTTYTSLLCHHRKNARIDDTRINMRTDYSNILYQASVFNQHCRVFAPRYRQAHFSVFLKKQNGKTAPVYEIAYKDIKAAFEYYLRNWNHDRPIIIAGHSQGTKMAERLLKEYVEDKPLQNKLVVAYLPGWSVPRDYFTSLKMCSDSSQTGCLCSWRTFREDFVPVYLKKRAKNSYVTNPLTWTTDPAYARRELNRGSILFNFNKVYTKTTGAKINDGLLWVQKPKIPLSYLSFTKNYHPADFKLFYLNIRDNISNRIASFRKK